MGDYQHPRARGVPNRIANAATKKGHPNLWWAVRQKLTKSSAANIGTVLMSRATLPGPSSCAQP